jgi:hypothetical protein
VPVKTIAAPHPLFGRLHQLPFHRIEVHVIQFLILFACAPDVEVIKSALPEVSIACKRGVVPEFQLGNRCLSSLCSQGSRDALFQRLHYAGRISDGGLADQQMDVVGHDDVAEKGEVVAVAHLSENSQKEVASPGHGEQRLPTITTASNEVKLSEAVAAFEAVFAHDLTLALFAKAAKSAAPTGFSQGVTRKRVL